MNAQTTALLKEKLDAENFAKLEALDNDKLNAFVADAIELCRPAVVKVCSDDPTDIATVRQAAIDAGEEVSLATPGHTIHFDGPKDQGRDKAATKYLVPEGMDLGRALNSTEREEGLAEVRGIMEGSMEGRTMYVRLFCLGPVNSQFSISAAQITDSTYVCHSEDLLYRSGYEQFKKLDGSGDFFRVLHSAGRLENNVSVDVDKRKIYIDIADDMVYSANTQYAGNTVGFKKLSLRLAIRRADREGWLAEHMFVMGVNGPAGRVTYFTGAFPSGCGKTSTAMLPGETIVGDDLAYLRVTDGVVKAVNVECGIFGIIRDVNADDDPVIHDVLTRPGEVIFSNILVKDDKPYWVGMGCDLPADGVNYSGDWHKGKTGANGAAIEPSHWNARYTIAMTALSNMDKQADDPVGVPVGGVIYGGRDSDTAVPVQESFDWVHGVVTMGATLESETTAATVEGAGQRIVNPMSNIDFVAIPIGKYISNNLNFADGLSATPRIFATNYFLKNAEGEFLNGKLDKGVWIKWMELRVHGDVEALEAPTGMIPKYEDLKRLFKEQLDKDYSQEDYIEQFTIRIPENLVKLDRAEAYFAEVADMPAVFAEILTQQRRRLVEYRALKGDYISPLDL